MTPVSTPGLIIFDAIRQVAELRSRYPLAKLLFLDSGLPDAEIASLLLLHQVNGIISPDTDMPRFLKAVRAVLGGDVWVEQATLKAVQDNGLSLVKSVRLHSLSDDDLRLIALVVQGHKNKDIAGLVCLSESTVKAHISRIYRRLQVKNRAHLATLCSRDPWLNTPSFIHAQRSCPS